MAVNESRNMNNEMYEGLTDGLVKKLTPDRGGVTESAAEAARAQEKYVQWVRLWSPEAMVEAQQRAVDRVAKLYG